MEEQPSLGELNRNIMAFRAEVKEDFELLRKQMSDYIPREVYQADRSAIEARLTTAERAREAARNALYAAAGSFVVAILVAILSFDTKG